MISKSGGARMMEAAYSLMQLAKTSVKHNLKQNFHIICIQQLRYNCLYAMLGDINIAEPGR
jgi:acetyl-CoA carboxylase carboxyl transferase subunit beta